MLRMWNPIDQVDQQGPQAWFQISNYLPRKKLLKIHQKQLLTNQLMNFCFSRNHLKPVERWEFASSSNKVEKAGSKDSKFRKTKNHRLAWLNCWTLQWCSQLRVVTWSSWGAHRRFSIELCLFRLGLYIVKSLLY